MKSSLFPTILILGVAMVFMLSSANAQTEGEPVSENKVLPVKEKELILGVPKTSEKNLYLLTDILERKKGIRFVQFCPNHKLVLLKYNALLYPTQKDVVNAILDQNLAMPVLIKQGTHAEVLELCIN